MEKCTLKGYQLTNYTNPFLQSTLINAVSASVECKKGHSKKIYFSPFLPSTLADLLKAIFTGAENKKG